MTHRICLLCQHAYHGVPLCPECDSTEGQLPVLPCSENARVWSRLRMNQRTAAQRQEIAEVAYYSGHDDLMLILGGEAERKGNRWAWEWVEREAA